MKQNDFPDNWDEERVQSVIAHYKQQTEDEAVAEDEVAFADNLSTVIEVPQELLPTIRELIAKCAAHNWQRAIAILTGQMRKQTRNLHLEN